MNRFRFFSFIPVFLLLLSACESTYKRETIRESVKHLALKEYGLDVDVAVTGNTLGVRFPVANLLSEMYSGDDAIYKKMNGLFTILARVSLSSDVAPEFIVLDIVDESNPHFHLVFTRYVEDIRKSMAEALSYSQSQDRLLQEFVINGKRIAVDPGEMDLIRIMMMAVDAAPSESPGLASVFNLEEVRFTDFVSRVVENALRRVLREKKSVKKEIHLRDVAATYGRAKDNKEQFKILLDLVSRPGPAESGKSVRLAPRFLETKVLPLAAEEIGAIFKSYRFNGFSNIIVVEKNSGKTLTVPAR